MKKVHKKILRIGAVLSVAAVFTGLALKNDWIDASSHREAPLIANDPLADNTDLYAFRSPDNPETVTIIANYVPAELPQGGPNYYSFGEDVRYEIHVNNIILWCCRIIFYVNFVTHIITKRIIVWSALW